MNFFEQFILVLKTESKAPTLFGTFHLVSIALFITLTILLCVFFKNSNEKVYNRIILIFWIIILTFEIYKQVAYSFNYVATNKVEWKYMVNIFPFQLCSMPLYVWPLIAFLKDGKVRDALLSFNMTFIFFGGLCTLIYPGQVFSKVIGLNVQTLLHHGLQVVSGIFTFVFYRKKVNFKFFLKGVIPFVIALLIALLMNMIVNAIFPNDINKTFWFNMFYLNPIIGTNLPILNMFYGQNPATRIVSYPLFLQIYSLGFVFVAFVMYITMFDIYKLVKRIKKCG